MRTPIVAANWKMHKTGREAVGFARELLPRISGARGVEVAIAAPFTALVQLRPALEGTGIGLAGQNVHPAAQGAFTGEIAVQMLRELGCTHVVVGHSERRALFGETSAFVAEKAAAAQAGGLVPIVCVGESLAERDAGRAFEVVGAQLDESLAHVEPERAAELVIAYEPVWAIGTGRTATPETAQEVHAFARERIAARFGSAAERIRIQYGGSVKPDNIAALMAQPDIDGALVGGASLDPASFSAIILYEGNREAVP